MIQDDDRMRRLKLLRSLEEEQFGVMPPDPNAGKLGSNTADFGMPPPPAPMQRPAMAPPGPPPMMPAADDGMAAATEADRVQNNRRVMETAARQLIAGFTQTPTVDTYAQPGDNVANLRKSQSQARLSALKALELGAQSKRWDAQKATADEERAYRRSRDAAGDVTKATNRKTDEELRREAIEASKANAQASRGIQSAQLDLARGAAEDKKIDRADKMTAMNMPFDGEDLVGGRGLSDSDRNKAREIAGLSNAALGGMDELRGALKAWIANPADLTLKAAVEAKVSNVAAALTAAQGGGVMASDEFRRVANAMGADVTSAGGIRAFIGYLTGENAAESGRLLLSKLDSARSITRTGALKRLEPYQYFPGKSGSTTPAQKTDTATAPSDMVRVKRKSDGKTGMMPRAKVDASKYEVVGG